MGADHKFAVGILVAADRELARAVRKAVVGKVAPHNPVQ